MLHFTIDTETESCQESVIHPSESERSMAPTLVLSNDAGYNGPTLIWKGGNGVDIGQETKEEEAGEMPEERMPTAEPTMHNFMEMSWNDVATRIKNANVESDRDSFRMTLCVFIAFVCFRTKTNLIKCN